MKPMPQKKQIRKQKQIRKSKRKCKNCAAVTVATTSSKKRNKRFGFRACLKSENSQEKSQIEANCTSFIIDKAKIIIIFPFELSMVRFLYILLFLQILYI